MNYKNIFLSSILAGALIALGCSVYLTVGGIVGALLFGLGLLSICTFKLDLYTGKVGYLLTEQKIDWKRLIITLLGNLIGATLLGLLISVAYPAIVPAAAALVSTKIMSVGTVAGTSFLCGMLMFIAVHLYKNNQTLGIFLAVPSFLLCGYEHCIAFIGYLAIGLAWNWLAIGYLGIAVIGNSLGAAIISLILQQIGD